MSKASKRELDVAAALLPTDEPALWEALIRGDVAARERLIENYLPYARILAAKIFGGRIDSDLEFAEYLQFATVGLIEAVDRFDPHKEILFKTFAGHRITGAVLNGIERLSEKRVQISTRKQLKAERRDSGKAALDQPEKDVFQQLAEVAISLALGYLLEDTTTPLQDDAILPEGHYGGLELRQLQDKIRSLVDSLPTQERMVIKYHYLNHVPFTIIAETLGVSKGRVSQIHRRALESLRETIKSVKSCDLAW